MAPSADNEGFMDCDAIDPSTTVVVVGAGPSGLILASNLVRFGVKVTLLDDRPDRTSTGRADGMQPKTIETFKQMRLADPLLRKGVRLYDISFWESTPDAPLQRKGRQLHYPDHLVGASDPYILLAHQGMVEDIFIQDMEARGVQVTRNSAFVECSRTDGANQLNVRYEDMLAKTSKTIKAEYLVGCDGARSKVRSFIPDARLEGETTNASWGVLDGVIETDFPDLWSKVAIRTHTAGSLLWIPRERNMTRLYVELSSKDGDRVDRSLATQEYVIKRAKEGMYPFSLEWKSIEWFGNYVVGQRVASHFADPELQCFIAGDAGHCHSALAAQGANTSMHDSFNLAWKLNLVTRGLAKPSLLATYEDERRKIAQDLINFDAEHCRAFEQGDAALAKNFDDNIRFIAGLGAEYGPNVLNRATQGKLGAGGLHPGALMVPAQVTRYIDANPVDIQLDIPLLSQFRIFIFVPNVITARPFLDTLCHELSDSVLSRASTLANQSYQAMPRAASESDEYFLPQRYTAASHLFTYALVTKTAKAAFEIADLPALLQQSRWTIYLDDVASPPCTDKWVGEVADNQAVLVNVRPDGYVGSMGCWDVQSGEEAAMWLEDYYGGFLNVSA